MTNSTYLEQEYQDNANTSSCIRVRYTQVK